jgi:beta-N-acetylhexosaminidase
MKCTGLVSAFSSYDAGTQLYVSSSNCLRIRSKILCDGSPGAMALAATGSVDLAEQVSIATGHEMKLAGINWAYRCV